MKNISKFLKSEKFSEENANEETKDWLKTTISAVILVFAFYFFFFCPPFNFPKNRLISIEKGMTLDQIAETLCQNDVIKSKFWFRVIVTIMDGEDGADAGEYFFDGGKNLFSIANSVAKGKFGFDPISITIPEGAASFEMAQIFGKKLAKLDQEEFLKKAMALEGYLFPDTYLFLPNATADDVIKSMRSNFIKKLAEIYDELKKFEKPVEDIIIMASLIEEEAKDSNARKIISGILWKRIKMGMPLQVDAAFSYFMGKNTFQLTLDDLKVESPYNTYKNKGLPSGPISNPGINSIMATIRPVETDYLFYLSDLNGDMHYARTFEEHKKNKQIYLK